MSGIFLAIQCSNISSKTMSYKCKIFNSQGFPPFFNRINKIMFCFFVSEFLWIVSNWRKPNAKSVKGMNLVMLFEMFKCTDVSQCSSSKAMKHDKMRQILFWVTICINFMDVVFFINLHIPRMKLLLKYEIWKSKCFFVNLIGLFCCNFIVLDKKFLLYFDVF